MALDFRALEVQVPAGTGPRSIPASVTFGSSVRTAFVALKGFELSYTDADHHIRRIMAVTNFIFIRGNVVNFDVVCDYRDENGDDRYEGAIHVTVMADVV